MHRGPAPGRGEIHLDALIGEARATAHLLAHMGDQALSEIHHVAVIGIGLIDLHRGELGVVAGADALVAEDATQLIDPLKAAHHEALEVQLGGDAQGERQVEGVVVRLERAGVGTTGHALQHRRFDLQEAALIQPAAHGTHRQGAAAEGFAGVGRDDQIQVALAIALLHIRQAMPLVGQRLQALAEHLPAGHLHRQLAAVGAAQRALHTDQIAGIHQGGDVGEVARRGRIRRCRIKGGFVQVQLDRAALIGQGEEGELAHHPAGHHAAGHRHRHVALLALGQIGVSLLQLSGAVAGLEAQAIGALTQGSQGLALLEAGLAQLRHRTSSAQLPAILQEHGAAGALFGRSMRSADAGQPAAAIGAEAASPTRWEA